MIYKERKTEYKWKNLVWMRKQKEKHEDTFILLYRVFCDKSVYIIRSLKQKSSRLKYMQHHCTALNSYWSLQHYPI